MGLNKLKKSSLELILNSQYTSLDTEYLTKLRSSILFSLISKDGKDIGELIDKYIDYKNFALFIERCEDNGIRYIVQNYPRIIRTHQDLEKIFLVLPLEEVQLILTKYFSEHYPNSHEEELKKFLNNCIVKILDNSYYDYVVIDKINPETGCILGVELTEPISSNSSLIVSLLRKYPEKSELILKKYGEKFPLISSPFANRDLDCIYQESNTNLDKILQQDALFYRDANSYYYSHDLAINENNKSQTFLHISKLDSASWEALQKQKDNFANIAVARVFIAEDPILLKEFIATFPRLQHIILPNNLRDNLEFAKVFSENGISFSYDLDHLELYKISKSTGKSEESKKKLQELLSRDLETSKEIFKKIEESQKQAQLELKKEQKNKKLDTDLRTDQKSSSEQKDQNIPQEEIESLEGQGEIEVRSLLGDELLPDDNNSNQVSEEFERLCNPIFVSDQNDLDEKIVESASKKILVITDEIERHANHFLELDPENTYYIDCPSKIDFDKLSISLSPDGNAQLSKEGVLEKFLQRQESSILLINWTAFTAQQKLALNTALDNQRSIAGHTIPENIQVISLVDKTPNDPSFITRHEEKLRSIVIIKKPAAVKNIEKATKRIDLQGLPNWRKLIFGRIIQNGNQLEWQKSDFVTNLENDESNFEILNIAKSYAEEFQYEIKQAKALGYFEYHGYKIKIPQDFHIEIDTENTFDFVRLNGDFSVATSVTYEKAPPGTYLVNTYLFDHLLSTKYITDGLYKEAEGLIDRFSNSAEPLKLFISENLNEEQWYCLFRRASDKNTKLELYLSPKAKLPTKIETKKIEQNSLLESTKEYPKIIVTNDSSKIETEGLVFDVEDSSFQDLIFRTEFESTETGFTNFHQVESEIFTRIKANEKVTLRGKFAPDLLAFLEPFLVSNYQNLTVIIEDESLAPNQKDCDKLSWLDSASYEVKFIAKESKSQEAKIEKELFDSSPLDLDSKTKSEEFIKGRKSKFEELLQSSDLLQLVGDSGVGKSSLMREFERDENSKFKICRGDIKSWAQDKTTDKIKILFIDESNIEDQHFVTFAPLEAGGNRIISYQGEIFELSENHKVVFAHNDKSYGGGRVEQKLFADGKVPEIYLQDFPASYIYEKILKESIYDKLSQEIKQSIDLLRNTTNHLNSAKFLATTKKIS